MLILMERSKDGEAGAIHRIGRAIKYLISCANIDNAEAERSRGGGCEGGRSFTTPVPVHTVDNFVVTSHSISRAKSGK